MTIPNAINIECPVCGERTLHEVLKGKMGGKRLVMETTVRCMECGHTHSTVVREEKPVSLPVIVSDQGESRRELLEMEPEEVLCLRDELFVGDTYVVVTGIESSGRRVKRAPAGDIDTLWAKRYDKIKVKVSVNKVHKTVPTEVYAMPDEEFYVGDIIPTGKEEEVVIHQIKTRRGMIRDGGVEARDIVRIYAKVIRVINA